MSINASQLAQQIASDLKAYTKEVTQDIEELKKEVSAAGVQQLKSSSPKLHGDYAKGWRQKKMKGAYVIYNATDYQLTHLLEKGHATRNGGRVKGRPHIQPVEEKIINDFVEGVEKVVRR